MSIDPFFFNDPATTEIYTLSLHDALPIWMQAQRKPHLREPPNMWYTRAEVTGQVGHCNYEHAPASGFCRNALRDRKSTRLNSSHSQISYAVFCLKKKKKQQQHH